MGSSPDSSPAPASPEFLRVFRAQAGADATMSFAQFMKLALYHPEVGYYRRNRQRVGYGPGTDFFTASTSGALFGELVAAAAEKLLRAAGRDPRSHTFVEIGAEPERPGVLAGVNHPFGASRVVRVGDSPALTGACVVFSNELFDAQPCTRTVMRRGQWREIGVRLAGDSLIEAELPSDFTTPPAPEDYQFDRPLAATELAAAIAAESWTGLFVAFDYGKTLRELTEETPGGTARAYFRHTQSNDLLARPGEQDLTCHICWDWLSAALTRAGFAEPVLQTQESFLLRHAGEAIAAIVAAEAARLSQRKLSLMQLVHPSHLGQKFQVLHALR